MRDLAELWIEAEVVPAALKDTLHAENMVVAFYGDGVLPHAGTRKFGTHLQFARMMMLVPEEGAVFTKSKEHLGSAYRYIRAAIHAGYLSYTKDDDRRTIVYPTELLTSLIKVSAPKEQELINA